MKNRLIMYLVSLLQGFVFYGSIATLYRQQRGISLLQIGVIESTLMLLMLLLEIPWGYIANRIGYKRTILISNGVYFLSKIVFWQAHGFTMFLTERVLMAVSLSGLSGCDSGLLYECSPGQNTRTVFGIYHSINTLGLLLASLTFSLWIQEDFALAAKLTMVAYGTAALASLFLTEPPHTQKQDKPHSIRLITQKVYQQVRNDKRIMLFLCATVLLAETNQFITVFLAPLRFRQSGFAIGDMGYLHILLTIAALTAACAGVLSKHMRQAVLQAGLLALAAVACLLLAVCRAAWVSLAAMLLRVAASIFAPLALDMQNAHAQSHARPLVLSVYSMLMSLAAIPMHLLYGRMAEWRMSAAMLFGGMCCITGLVAQCLFQWAERKKG